MPASFRRHCRWRWLPRNSLSRHPEKATKPMPHSTSPLAGPEPSLPLFRMPGHHRSPHRRRSRVEDVAGVLCYLRRSLPLEGGPYRQVRPGGSESPSTYEGIISIEGQFQIHDTFGDKNREALIRVTATSILYGACREMIAGFTARSIHGILSLPSISFRQPKEIAAKP